MGSADEAKTPTEPHTATRGANPAVTPSKVETGGLIG